MNKQLKTMKKAILSTMAVLAMAAMLTSCKKSNEIFIDDFQLPGKVTKYRIVKMYDIHHPGKIGGKIQVPLLPEPILLEVSDVDNLPNDHTRTSNPIRINSGCGVISANMVHTMNSLMDIAEFKDILSTPIRYPKLKDCSIHGEIIELLRNVENKTIQPSGEFKLYGKNREVIMELMIVK